MAEPNIVAVKEIKGKNADLAVTTTATAIISAVATGQVAKVNSLIVSNVDGVNAAWVTVDRYRGSTARRICYRIDVEPGTSIEIFARPYYLQEGDALRLTAEANSDLEATVSYEVIS